MTQKALGTYLVGAVIVWVGIFAAAALTLYDTDQMGTMLIIMGGGAFFFIILIPGWLRTLLPEDDGE